MVVATSCCGEAFFQQRQENLLEAGIDLNGVSINLHQDNDPKHLLVWSSQSLDLNPVETLCQLLSVKSDGKEEE